MMTASCCHPTLRRGLSHNRIDYDASPPSVTAGPLRRDLRLKAGESGPAPSGSPRGAESDALGAGPLVGDNDMILGPPEPEC